MKIVNLTSEEPMGDHGLWSQQVTSSDGEQSLMWLWYMQSSIPSGLSAEQMMLLKVRRRGGKSRGGGGGRRKDGKGGGEEERNKTYRKQAGNF